MLSKNSVVLVGLVSSLVLNAKPVKKNVHKKIALVKDEIKKEVQEDKKVSSQESAQEPQQQDVYKWLQTYADIVSIVESKAFRTVDFSKFVQDSLRQAVAGVDAHCAFYSSDSYKEALDSTSGEFSGIGVSIISKTPEDEELAIIDVIPQGPAEIAGVRAGDRVFEINGEKVKGLSTDEAVAKFKGKVGTSVKIKIIRDKKPLELAVTRDIIKDQTSLCYHFPQQEVYYLALKMFNEVSAEQISSLLAKANAGKCRGIVLDLRRNPGGTLDSAIEMAELFLPKGSLVTVTKNNKKEFTGEYKTTKDPLLKSNLPIFVLVDNFTASAAEILAGCLKYHSEQQQAKGHNLMVFLLGTTTFGKGSVQELIPVKNGCALKLTTMLYYLPGDVSIQAEGIAPDFTIKPKMVPVDELKWVTELYGKETSLKHHITKAEVEGKRGVAGVDNDKKQDDPGNISFWQRWFGSGQTEVVASENAANVADKDEQKKKKSFDEQQLEALAMDTQVQASINMISLLAMARRLNPQLVESRAKALEFLKSHYLTDDMPKLVKIQ